MTSWASSQSGGEVPRLSVPREQGGRAWHSVISSVQGSHNGSRKSRRDMDLTS